MGRLKDLIDQQHRLIRDRTLDALPDLYAEGGVFAMPGAEVPARELPGSRDARGDGVLYGSPARVAEDIAALDAIGIGGIIGTFRLGPMPHEVAAESLSLFLREVAPQFRR